MVLNQKLTELIMTLVFSLIYPLISWGHMTVFYKIPLFQRDLILPENLLLSITTAHLLFPRLSCSCWIHIVDHHQPVLQIVAYFCDGGDIISFMNIQVCGIEWVQHHSSQGYSYLDTIKHRASTMKDFARRGYTKS